MARVYISFSQSDKEIFYSLANLLRQSSHTIVTDLENVIPGDSWRNQFAKEISKADVFIILWTENSSQSKNIKNEINKILSFKETSKLEKLVIPVRVGLIQLPQELESFNAIDGNPNQIETIVSRINESISSFEGKVIAEAETSKQLKDNIEKTSTKYIQQTLSDLKTIEEAYQKKARWWYLAGFGLLVLSAGFSLVFFFSTFVQASKSEPAITILFLLAFKGIIVISLLIACSKYSFSMGKINMNEALKTADRIHAISFGKFYMQISDGNLKLSEIKEVFQHWNIGVPHSQINLDAPNYDPKIIEAISNILKNKE